MPPDLAGWAHLYLRLQVEGVKSMGTLKLERYSLNNFIAFFEDYHQGRGIGPIWLPEAGSPPSLASLKILDRVYRQIPSVKKVTSDLWNFYLDHNPRIKYI